MFCAVEIVIAGIGILLNAAQLLGGWDSLDFVQLLLWIAIGVQAWKNWGNDKENEKD